MRRTALALVLLASACGAKSELLVPGSEGRSGAAGVAGSGGVGGVAGTGGASGSGGVGATGGASGSGGVGATGGASGSAGASGSGGEPPWATGTTCYGFSDRGSRLIDDAAEREQRRPELVLSSSDAKRVTLAFAHPLVPVSPGIPLGQVSFEAWMAWPASPLGQAAPLAKQGGADFRVAWGFSNTFALLSSVPRLFPAVTPGQALAPTDGTSVGGAPAFLTRGAADHLYGYTTGGTGNHLLFTARAPDDGRSVLSGTGCASDTLHASAIREPGHYLVATSSSRSFGTCLNASDGSTPADRFQVALVPDSGQASLAWEWNDAVDELLVVPRSDGAWVVWQPTKNVTQRPIFAARLDPDGNLLTLPNSFVDYGKSAFAFAADRVADDLALGWIEAIDPSEPTIHVALYDQDALNTPHLDFLIQPAPSEWPAGPLALLGSPDGQHLLVSWEADGADGRSIVVTRRLDCVGLD